MAAQRYTIQVRPELVLLEGVLDPLASGELRIPKFQRPFVWRPEQMLDLFDSIERGYPIGNLLFWETTDQQASLTEVAGIPVPEPPDGKAISYVLDGHQRLSTLFGTLRRTADAHTSAEQHDWMWLPYRVLGEADDHAARYRHWRRVSPPPANYLPLHAVLRTIDFLAWARELPDRVAAQRLDADVSRLIAEAEEVATRIKSYQPAVVRLKGGSLKDAVEVFSRINSTGQAMTPAQMVSALTYQGPDQESLADRLDRMIEEVDGTGFGPVSSNAVFRAILAATGEENIQDARWDALARRVGPDLSPAVDATESALQGAVDFLRDEIGVPLARLIPYEAQLTLLIEFFRRCPKPEDDRLAELARWFWTTSWSGHFAGANTTQIKEALTKMQRFADAGGRVSEADVQPRPFPDRFDLRSARVRAYLVWELREFRDRLDAIGQPIDVPARLGRDATATYRQVVYHPRMAEASSPANRLVLPTPPRTSVKNTLLGLSGDLLGRVSASHGIPEAALDALRTGADAEFVNIRARYLAQHESAFMARYDVQEKTPLPGRTDIDTE